MNTMNTMQLMQALFTSASIKEAACVSIESGLASAKELYMAWGKESGHKVADLNSTWKQVEAELKPKAKKSAGGFAEEYYDWLAAESRTEQEAANYVMGADGYEPTSPNVRAHFTHYLNIWALAQSVRTGQKVERTLGGKPKAEKAEQAKAEPEEEEQADAWEYDAAHPYEDVRSAWETLARVMKSKRPSKTKVHPDRVAKFGDKSLTEAYTKAFQILNK